MLGYHFYVIFFEELFLVESGLVPKSVVVVISVYGFFGKGVGKGLCGEVDVEIKHSDGTADARRTNELTRPRSVFSMM